MDINELKKLISKKLTLLLKSSGKTIEATAYELGMDFSQYYRLLKGQRMPLLPTLLRINKIYGVTMNWWFEDVDKIPERLTKTNKNPLEFQLLNTFKKLNCKTQKTAVAVLKALAKG
ncbi:MAG: helix-turn-helix domain-containing protein [Candidatus Margulisbacteria bacterium]|jgi:transcriptional regulator with XRE-family HTH domain|nr:helix-turn-helix domain-containing protein [Candidatus Margulisiibacteriota bacterium]